jgi:TFIIF-interacting CTD phosphatase-like protein
MSILGNKKIKLYISIRSYAKEMLDQLKNEFELILFSNNARDYTEKIAEALTITPTEKNPTVFN